jgi:hypothetical protein
MRLRRSRGGAPSEGSAKRTVGSTVSSAFTPKNAKRAVAVGKVLSPVLVPLALRAATVARGMWDERRARRLGVTPGELNSYSGKGTLLYARIVGLANAMRQLTAGAGGERSDEVTRFIASTEPRLADLAAAVRASELMPGERRRAAHRAVSAELDRIEPQLLDLLGVHPPH